MRFPARRCLVVALLLGLSAQALAQDTPEAPEEPAYQDRVIASENLEALPPDEDEVTVTDGKPREIRAELSAGRTQRGDSRFDEYGVLVGGFWETDRWGSFSIDASLARSAGDQLSREDRDWRGLVTVWQRNLYLKNGWKMDNGVGVLNTPSLPLQRSQYRFFLPSVPFAGVSVDASRAQTGLQVQGAAGRAGLYTGTRLAGFELEPGNVAALGAQWRWSPSWTGSVSYLGTDNQIVADNQGQPILSQGQTQAVHAAAAWEKGRDRLQVNVLQSSGDTPSAIGVWLDGASRRGRYAHNYGVFRLEPGLAWGALPINNDAQGAYYRLAYQHARWSWSGGLDQIKSLSGKGFDGTYATGYARYQATSSLGYGASASVRDASDTYYAYQLFVDKRTRWGQSRLQWDQSSASGPGSSSNWQVSVDQSWPMKTGTLLSTSLGYGSVGFDGEPATRTWLAAVNGSKSLTGRLSVDGSVRWTHGSGPYAQRGTDANVGLSWRANANWSASATLYQNQGSQRSPFVLDPLAPENPFITLPRDRSFFFTLRYQQSAGRSSGVIGAAPGAPFGAIVGTVFLDDNSDGTRAASELGAANVTVVLNGQFSVRTDSQGRFEFPRVAVGSHTLQVQGDNLPLPWTIESAGRTVEVDVRDQVNVDIGAVRPR